MAINIVSYQDKDLKPLPTKYIIFVSKGGTSTTHEYVEPITIPDPVYFINKTYVNENIPIGLNAEIWELETYTENNIIHEKHTNITGGVSCFIQRPENRIIIQSAIPFSGYIKYKL